MSSNFHVPIIVGESNSPGTINSRLGTLDTAISAMSGAGGVFTRANGAAAAGQNNVTVTSATGFVANANVVYALVGGVIEHNVITSINGLVFTMSFNIGTGGIASGAIIAQETPGEAAARGNYDTLAARANAIDRLPGAMRLGANVLAAATSMTLRTAPSTLGSNLGWLVIDPFTTECEIRRVASVSGTTINFHDALDYSHSTDDAILWQAYPDISIEMFGAYGDDLNDDTTAIQRACDAAYNLALTATSLTGGVTLAAGSGKFIISNTITLQSRVALVGRGGGTLFKAKSTFPGSTPMFKLGDATDVFECRLENLSINGENYADIGVYSAHANELAGLLRVSIHGCMDYGIQFTSGTCQNFFIRSVLVQMNDANVTAVGIYIHGGTGAPRGIDDISSNAVNVTIAANIQLEACVGMSLTRIHTENATDGILIGSTNVCAGIHISGFVPSGNTNGVRISNAAANTNIVCNALFKGVDTTNLLVDELAGTTLTSSALGHYLQGQLRATRGNRQMLDGWNRNDVAAGLGVTALTRYGLAAPLDTYQFMRAGSVTGINISSTEARTAGTLTVTLYINGGATALTCVLNGTNTTKNQTLALPGAYPCSAQDRIGARVSTDASWAPVTADIAVNIEIET